MMQHLDSYFPFINIGVHPTCGCGCAKLGEMLTLRKFYYECTPLECLYYRVS